MCRSLRRRYLLRGRAPWRSETGRAVPLPVDGVSVLGDEAPRRDGDQMCLLETASQGLLPLTWQWYSRLLKEFRVYMCCKGGWADTARCLSGN